MRKIAISLALASTAVAAPAIAQEEKTFTHNGVEYEYTTRTVGDATMVTGTDDRGKAFRLYVTDSRVRGTYNGSRVSFDRSEAQARGIPMASR
ncbi:hypothetical protein [Croceicoccus sediminis]|uniref:hypothetical protein n=1 Tax=Croceicoccus sediminis TaxID=2571150 RepID=UPI00118337A8|nr:hypothetical protein [Croceicoccus sediminis]